MKLNIIHVLLILSWVVAVPAMGVVEHGDEGRNFDARAETSTHLNVEPSAVQLAAVGRLSAALPDLLVSYDDATGATRTLWNAVGYLTGDSSGEPLEVAMAFVRENLDLLGLSDEDLAGHEVTDSVLTQATGATHIYLRQRHLEIPVYNGQLHLNVGRRGRLLSVNNAFVPGLGGAVSSLLPTLEAAEAVTRAAAHLGVESRGLPRALDISSDPQRRTMLESDELSTRRIEAALFWLPTSPGEVRLVWNFQLFTRDHQHAYDFNVDADSGQVWTRFDWVASDSYEVYPLPVESPNHGSRAVVNNPADASASPFGWHDVDGIPGYDFTIMRGNNAHAYDEIVPDGLPPAVEPDCGPLLFCNFPIDLTSAPGAYTSAAVANLFYWNNIIHDVQFRYGFDEAAGNFQVTNYTGAPGGSDDVRAEAQDGGGLNNANMLTPPDGSRPRMQMFLWNQTSPFRDGDLENSIIVHEYGHGISNRLVGGPGNVSCLNNLQQPGEGLSDWWALAYTALPSHTGPIPRGIGTYVLGQPTSGPGIRALPYSTDSTVNNWTYASIAGMSVPHGVGSVWAQGAWEVYWALVDQYGFNSDLYDAFGDAGNQRMMLYLNEGLKNTICQPAFTDVRDGIIQAAIDNHDGEDVCRVWRAFADFGLGTDAVSGGPFSLSPTDGFSVPASCQLNPQVFETTGVNTTVAALVCPAGTRVAGGGCLENSFTTNNRMAFPLYPASFGVEGFVCIQDAVAPTVTAYSICVNDSGSIGFEQNEVSVAAGLVAVAACSAGKKVVGGGCADDTFNSALLRASVPLTTTTFGQEAWGCIFDSNPGGITAYSTCVDEHQLDGIQVIEEMSSTTQSVVASCPASTLALGGGCLDFSVTANLQATLPLTSFGLESWACVYDTNTSNITAYALCLAP